MAAVDWAAYLAAAAKSGPLSSDQSIASVSTAPSSQPQLRAAPPSGVPAAAGHPARTPVSTRARPYTPVGGWTRSGAEGREAEAMWRVELVLGALASRGGAPWAWEAPSPGPSGAAEAYDEQLQEEVYLAGSPASSVAQEPAFEDRLQELVYRGRRREAGVQKPAAPWRQSPAPSRTPSPPPPAYEGALPWLPRTAGTRPAVPTLQTRPAQQPVSPLQHVSRTPSPSPEPSRDLLDGAGPWCSAARAAPVGAGPAPAPQPPPAKLGAMALAPASTGCRSPQPEPGGDVAAGPRPRGSNLPVRHTFVHYDLPGRRGRPRRCSSAPGALCSRSAEGPGLHRYSEAHLRGQCRPCAYHFYKEDGCRQGDACDFCHSCPVGEMRRRKKERRQRMRAQQAHTGQVRD